MTEFNKPLKFKPEADGARTETDQLRNMSKNELRDSTASTDDVNASGDLGNYSGAGANKFSQDMAARHGTYRNPADAISQPESKARNPRLRLKNAPE